MTTTRNRNRFDNRRRLNKYQHYKNLPRAQVVFEYTNQQPLELLQTVKHFINFMKTCPVSREQFKTNKLSRRNFHNEVNESEIHTSNLEEIQQLINKDTDLVFEALVAADYIDEIDCMNSNGQQIAWLTKKYNPDNYFTAIAEQLEIYHVDKLGPITGTVFQIFANNKIDTKINTLFDTGAVKSVVSYDTFQKLNYMTWTLWAYCM